MAELLLELFSEEIPAGMQAEAATEMARKMSVLLGEAGINYKSAASYTTPRRLVLVVEGLADTQQDSVSEKRGPRVGAPEQAVNGFLRSTGLTLKDLEKRSTNKGEFYFAVVKKKGSSVSKELVNILQDVIADFTWPKSMRWGNNHIRWVRPLHNILCLLDGKVLPVKFGHLTANDNSFGHRFLSADAFKIKDFADYSKKLKDNYVILDPDKRRKLICKEIENITKAVGLSLREDEELLNEVVGLVEWPVVLLGTIDDKFMSVPNEALISAMRSHQKYFSLLNSKGKLAPYFIVVANIKTPNKSATVINGNERVLRARLEDAKFFWDQDRRIGLEERGAELGKIIFHAKLGTLKDKVARITELSKLLCVWIPHANLVLVEQAAKMCKSDLLTEMVGEFPDLQGLMGYYYAVDSGHNEDVALAIKEHYQPVGPSDVCPKSPLSIAVALADKVDTLVGLFAADERPTGSKDPYALRRASLGVIRIILENNLRVPLRLLFEKSICKYPKDLFKPAKGERRFIGRTKPKAKQEAVINDLLEFFADRLKVILKSQDVRPDLIQAVFDDGSEDDFNRLVNRVEVLSDFLETEDGINLLAAYRRAANIVTAEEKKDQVKYTNDPDVSLLEDHDERELYAAFDKARPKIEKNIKNENFAQVMTDLAKLRKPIDRFLDNVMVNCDDKVIRKNRLLLLAMFNRFLRVVADFSVIEG